MATVTKSIGSGKDYSTIALWVADLDDDTPYDAGDDVIGELYDGNNYDAAHNINGGSTLGLNSITLQAAAGEEHTGTADTGARILRTGITDRDFQSDNFNTVFRAFEIDFNGQQGGSDHEFVYLDDDADNYDNVVMRQCIVHDGLGNHNTAGITLQRGASLYDTIVYDFDNQHTGGGRMEAVAGRLSNTAEKRVRNCTIHNTLSTNGSGDCHGAAPQDKAAQEWQNNVVTDSGGTTSGTKLDYLLAAPSFAVMDHNLASDTSASGTGSLDSKTAANQYVSTTGGSEDLQLKSGADAIGAGADFTTVGGVQFDIVNFDRDTEAVTWDMGASQFVVLTQTVTPSAIASLEAFGTLLIELGISLSAIASAEAIGSATITTGAVTLTPTAIASTEAFGSAMVNLTVTPSGIASLEVIGSPTITTGVVTLTPSAISSAEAIGSATVVPGSVSITPSGIASLEAFGSATLTTGAVSITPSSMTTLEAFGSATVVAGVVTVTPTGIGSLETIGGLQVNLFVPMTGIASSEAFGTAVLGSFVFPTSIASAEAFGTAVMVPGSVTITPSGIGSAEAFGTTLIEVFVIGSGIASAEAFGTLVMSPGVVTLLPAGMATGEALGSATVTPGGVSVVTTGVASGEAIGSQQVNLVVLPSGIAGAEAFGTATVTVGTTTVTATGIASLEGFGTALISTGLVVVQPSSVTTSEAVGSHTVVPGATFVIPSGIASAAGFGTAQLDLDIFPSSISGAEAFGSSTILMLILPVSIVTVEAFGTAAVSRAGDFFPVKTTVGAGRLFESDVNGTTFGSNVKTRSDS